MVPLFWAISTLVPIFFGLLFWSVKFENRFQFSHYCHLTNENSLYGMQRTADSLNADITIKIILKNYFWHLKKCHVSMLIKKNKTKIIPLKEIHFPFIFLKNKC